jgi:hypothetical protein
MLSESFRVVCVIDFYALDNLTRGAPWFLRQVGQVQFDCRTPVRPRAADAYI